MSTTRETLPSAEPAVRSVGRPRADGSERSGDVASQILEAAASLFVKQGYQGTSTREIAAAVGLRQGSLIHYFAKKQDILLALINRSLRPAFEHVEILAATGLPAEVQFYRYIHSDCLALCSDQWNIACLVLQPEIRTMNILEVEVQHDRLRRTYSDLIEAAADHGVFHAPNLALATNAAFGMVESVSVWYPDETGVTPLECADLVASTIVAGLLVRSRDLDEIIDLAAQAPAAPSS